MSRFWTTPGDYGKPGSRNVMTETLAGEVIRIGIIPIDSTRPSRLHLVGGTYIPEDLRELADLLDKVAGNAQ